MNLYTVALFAFIALAAADVSHLNSEYLPPNHHQDNEVSTIAQLHVQSPPYNFGSSFQAPPDSALPEASSTFNSNRYSSPDNSLTSETGPFKVAPDIAVLLNTLKASEYKAGNYFRTDASYLASDATDTFNTYAKKGEHKATDSSYSASDTAASSKTHPTSEYKEPALNFFRTDANYLASDVGSSLAAGESAASSNRFQASEYKTAAAESFETDSSYSAPGAAALLNSFKNAEYQATAPDGAASFSSFKTSEYEAPAANSYTSASDSAILALDGASSLIAPQTTGFSFNSAYPVPSLVDSPPKLDVSPSLGTEYASDGGYVY